MASKRHADVALAAQRLQIQAKELAEAQTKAHAEARARAEAEAKAHAEARARVEAEARAQADATRAQARTEAPAAEADSEAHPANSRSAAAPEMTFSSRISSTTTTIVTRTSHERYAPPAAAPGRGRLYAQQSEAAARADAESRHDDDFLLKLQLAEAHDAATAAAAEAAGLTIKAKGDKSPSKAITTSPDARSLQRHRRRECRDGGCGLCGINVFAPLSPSHPKITLSPARGTGDGWGSMLPSRSPIRRPEEHAGKSQQTPGSRSDDLTAESIQGVRGSRAPSLVQHEPPRARGLSPGYPKEEEDWRRPIWSRRQRDKR